MRLEAELMNPYREPGKKPAPLAEEMRELTRCSKAGLRQAFLRVCLDRIRETAGKGYTCLILNRGDGEWERRWDLYVEDLKREGFKCRQDGQRLKVSW